MVMSISLQGIFQTGFAEALGWIGAKAWRHNYRFAFSMKGKPNTIPAKSAVPSPLTSM